MGPLAKLFPGPAILSKIAIYGLTFLLGGAVGNYHATKAALERELQNSADRQRENHLVLFEEFRRRNAEYKAHIEQQIGADAAAYAMLTKGKAEAERAAQQARASLRIALGESEKLSEANDGLRKVNEILAERPVDPGCILPPSVRQALDAAADADPSHAGDSEAAASRGPDDGAAAAQAVTCRELARGYVELGEYGRMMRTWVLAWQAWARIALQ